MAADRLQVYRAAMMLTHLAISVADQERSRRFYEAHFGFGACPATRYPDGVIIIRNGDAFDLALEQGGTSGRPEFFHFGFRCAEAEQVRKQRARLLDDGIALVEDDDTENYVGMKCLDPDGYQVEVYWEP